MAAREIATRRAAPWPPTGKPPEDIWQGYQVNQTRNNGIEMMVRTSTPNYAVLWIGLTVAIMGLLVVVAAVPAAGPRDHNYSQGATIVFFSFLELIVVFGLAATIHSFLPDEIGRTFTLETVEIRPDGVTINRNRFFTTGEVATLSVEPEGTGTYNYACQGIIGTRQMVLLCGFDKSTAFVLRGHLEEARRIAWAKPEYDD